MKNFARVLLLCFCLMFSVNTGISATQAPQKPAIEKTATEQVTYTMLQSPTLVVNNPYVYLNKNIQFPAKFNKFSTLGLDYRPAMRESQVYIGILIERDDVGNNVIPLSEFKMFLKRSDAEKLTDLEAGDSLLIKGKVFSAALGDPWMDIKEIKILSSKAKKDDSKKQTDK